MGTQWENNAEGGGGGGGGSYVACSPRYSGPMTRRSHSQKKNQECDIAMGSPKQGQGQGHSGFSESGECGCWAMGGLLNRSVMDHVSSKKGARQQLFCFFVLLVAFFVVVKVVAMGWLGSQIEQQTGLKVGEGN